MNAAILQNRSRLTKQNLDKNKLITLLEKRRKQELETMIMCQEKEEQLMSAGAKLLLAQIRMDSAKHANILQILIELIKEDVPEDLWDYKLYRYVSRGTTEYTLQSHIKVETDLLQNYEQIIEWIDDPGIKLLLHFVIKDEQRHHKLMREVVKRLSKLDLIET